MKATEITPVILCYNEQDNLPRTLGALSEFPRVVVLDSGSTDASQQIASQFPNVVWSVRAFDRHAEQWNAALALAETDWVLSLDADYVLDAAVLAEIGGLQPRDHPGFRIGFRFWVFGRPLRAALLPPRIMLFRRSAAHYVQDGHTQVLQCTGDTPLLQSRVNHDDRKPVSRWLWAQTRYVELEASKLVNAEAGALDFADRLRTYLLIMPWLAPLYVLFGKRVLLDGWRGLHYALSRATTEMMLSLALIDRKLSHLSEKKS